jgi:hypothetical protein
VPLVGRSIVIDPDWPAKACAAVCAARNHYIRPIAVTGWPHAGQRVDVVVSRPAGAVNPEELLSGESSRIYVAASKATAHVNSCHLVKGWRHIRVLRVSRADTPEAASAIVPADKKIAVAGNIECPPMCRVRQTKRTLPGGSAISGPVEQT